MFKKYTFGEYFLIFYLIDCFVFAEICATHTPHVLSYFFILVATTVLYERVATKDIFIEESNGRQCFILLLFNRYRKRISYLHFVA